MKNFIVTLAVFLLLIIFPLQTALETVNEQRKSKFNNIVHVAVQQARKEGGFTKEIEKKMRDSLEALVDPGDINEIKIALGEDGVVKYRDDGFDQDIIKYSIEIPIGKIVAVPRIFGLSKEEEEKYNKYIVKKEGSVLSEKLRSQIKE